MHAVHACTANMHRHAACLQLLFLLLVACTNAQQRPPKAQCSMPGGRDLVPPAALTSVGTVLISERTAHVSWGPPSNAACYTGVSVRWETPGQPPNQRTVTSAFGELRGLRWGSTYTITVAPVSVFGEGPPAVVTVTIPPQPAPACVADGMRPPGPVTGLTANPVGRG